MVNKIICGLCGEEIEAPKGTRGTALSREQEQGAHDSCVKTHQDLIIKHQIHPNAEFAARISALLKLHPELETTKTMMDYRAREIALNKEVDEAFPYLKLKQQKQKAEEEAKAKANKEEAENK